MNKRIPIKRVVVFGGSGFLGSSIATRLALNGFNVLVAVRRPESDAALAVSKLSELIEPVYTDVRDETSVSLALDGCHAAVNAVGLYVENKAETFEAVHEIGAVNVAHQASAQGLARLVHISGIGADMNSPSPYVRSRGKAELLVSDVFAAATILRPSVIFGPTDKFLNTLQQLAVRIPVLPLFGRGKTRLQPVFVRDVADAAVNAIGREDATGKVYELGGPHTYTYRELLELLLRYSRQKRLLLPVPFLIWDLLAAIFSILANPPITEAQVALMKRDCVVAKCVATFKDLDISPAALESVLTDYDFAQTWAFDRNVPTPGTN